MLKNLLSDYSLIITIIPITLREVQFLDRGYDVLSVFLYDSALKKVIKEL